MSRSNKQSAGIPVAAIEGAKRDIFGTISKYIRLTKNGSEYRALCPFHFERTPSFTVSPDKGIFYCFGCGAGSDAIDFVQLYEDVSFPEAVRIIAGNDSGDTKTVKRLARDREADDEWVPISPIPDDLGVVPMDIWNYRSGDTWTKIKSSARWAYRDADGNLLGYTCRFDLPMKADGSPGGKEIIPQSYCVNKKTGETRWRWLSFAKPRPIFGLEKLAANPKAQALIVEGEKACEAAQLLFESSEVTRDRLVVVSWPGGAKAVKHVDWSTLAGRSVGLLPDADMKRYGASHPNAGQEMPFLEQPGTVCMVAIANLLEGKADSIKFIIPPSGVADGWDLADPLPEGFNLLAHMRSAAMPMHEFQQKYNLDHLLSEELAESNMAAYGNSIDVAVPSSDLRNDQSQEKKSKVARVKRPKLSVVRSTSSCEQFSPNQHAPEQAGEVRYGSEQNEFERGAPFSILGYDHDYLFIYSHKRRQVITTSVQKLSRVAGLIEVADLKWWETRFCEDDKGFRPILAANWIARIAEKRGVYDPAKVRGRGAWDDAGRNVFHLGDRLIVEGEFTDFSSIRSHYVYEARPDVVAPNSVALSGQEGAELLRVARLFRWESPGAAELLMGWVFLAPICGILKWRPHIWISASPGVGKSTLMNDFIKPLMPARWALYEQGLSTEAALRQKLVADARPVLLDEFECNTESDRRRLEGLLTLIRISSSSGEISRGTTSGRANTYVASSMFCLASVGVGLHRQSDQSRIARLELTNKGGSTDQWDKLQFELLRIKEDMTLSQRLFVRMLARLSIVRASVDVFTKVAGTHFKSQREGDQYGTLLAGCWCLTNDSVPTAQDAQYMLRSNDWADLGAGESSNCDDARDALNAVLCASLRLDSGDTFTVSQLIEIACDKSKSASQVQQGGRSVKPEYADHFLQVHGIRVYYSGGKESGPEVLFAKAHRELISLIADTDYASDLHGRLARLPGARKSKEGKERAKVRFAGPALRYIAIPIGLCLGKDDDELASDASSETKSKNDES